MSFSLTRRTAHRATSATTGASAPSTPTRLAFSDAATRRGGSSSSGSATRALDGAWSGRFWIRRAPRTFERRAAQSVRVVGSELSTSYHPDEPLAGATASQVATVSVWGEAAQQQLVRAHVGIVGLGSVGSLVAEAVARMGLRRLTYIDFD